MNLFKTSVLYPFISIYEFKPLLLSCLVTQILTLNKVAERHCQSITSNVKVKSEKIKIPLI